MNAQAFQSARERYLAREPLKAIAADLDLSVETLLARLRRAGVASRARALRAGALAELPGLVASGYTRAELAERYGVHAFTITKWSRRADVTLPRARSSYVPDRVLADEVTIERYLAGERTLTLAADLGVCQRTVRRRLQRAGISTARQTRRST